MKHLIIGGCGFIGYNLAYWLLLKGEKVRIVDNLSRRGTALNLNKLQTKFKDNIEFIFADIRVDQEILDLVVREIDIIYHLAAQVAVTTSVTNPRNDFRVNALGTFNVLEAIRLNNPNAILIYSSTNKVYGVMEEIKINENDKQFYYEDLVDGINERQLLDFHSPYGCSKGTAEQYVRDYYRIYGIKSVVFRQSCIYGPNQFGIEDQGWVAWFTIAAMNEKSIKIYGNGKQVRDVLHVNDLIRGYFAVSENIDKTQGQVFNIGGGKNNISDLISLLKLLEKKINKKIDYSFHNWRPGDQMVYISDISKIKNIIGWVPEIDLERGIDSLIQWTNDNKQLIKELRIV